MDLFACDNCGCVDAVQFAYPDGPPQQAGKSDKVEWRCTHCQTGEWHDLFPLERFRPQFDIVVNRPSGLGLGEGS